MVVIVSLVVAFALLMSNWHLRWVVFNWYPAVDVATRLLNGSQEAEDRFIEYVVYSTNGCVIFSAHGSERGVAYCGKLGKPELVEPKLHKIFGPWYRVEYFQT